MKRVPFDTVAAVDLGSNSFHMVVAKLDHDELRVIDRLRERTALAEGLDDGDRLKAKVAERAIDCLGRFGQRLAHMPVDSVRAVGTNTLRRMRESRAFLQKAQAALGHRIEVISGREEARLIYLGVSHAHSDDSRRRLVVDIGGGSTECILGEGLDILESDSLQMGCVGWTVRHFPDGAITRERMEKAQIAAGLELQGLARRYKRLGWESAIGSSGTIVACEEMLRSAGWSEGGIDAKGLRKLRRALVEAGHVSKLQLPALQADRAGVLAGGVAVLSAIFKILDIDELHASPGALREGVLHDLLGRMRHEDVREPTIRSFARRYHVDLEQAGRVERTSLALLAQVAAGWELESAAHERTLSWAARLHEIGLGISYSGYHRHGAYIVANADMNGFSKQDQQQLAALIESHRRKPDPALFQALPTDLQEPTLRLAVLLRLAARLHRSRSPRALPELSLFVRKRELRMEFAEGWLAEHPLSRADLDEEAGQLTQLGVELHVS
ncbi:MAG: Ppx/GppA family phosphatase [Planctomycetaceae bacterium]|jgi:exopolyphosphatase/guanosine-5'-triphosphate,3'-diphosphate pyrophosphatase|nr:Ppx/GppA family phosphatase [Planctomycetaceae bacterium]